MDGYRGSFPGINQQEREIDNIPPFRAEVKN
jgi:hypothetical protein